MNTALFWEYDTRLGRRWNVDIKRLPFESFYSVFGGNPIMTNDINGDSWKVATDDATRSDVTGMVTAGNRKYVDISSAGDVSLNFGTPTMKDDGTLDFSSVLSEAQVTDALRDPGLATIKELVDAPQSFFYSTSGDFQSRGLKESREAFIAAGGRADIYDGVNSSYTGNSWDDVVSGTRVSGTSAIFYKNASETTYGLSGSGVRIPTLMPRTGFNGQVAIAPGSVLATTRASTIETDVRIQMVSHELYENFLRTSLGLSYVDAHNRANARFNGNYSTINFIGR
jgi:hypothetical protein